MFSVAFCNCGDKVVDNRATSDTFLSLKRIRIHNFHIPFFESIITSLRLKKVLWIALLNTTALILANHKPIHNI